MRTHTHERIHMNILQAKVAFHCNGINWNVNVVRQAGIMPKWFAALMWNGVCVLLLLLFGAHVGVKSLSRCTIIFLMTPSLLPMYVRVSYVWMHKSSRSIQACFRHASPTQPKTSLIQRANERKYMRWDLFLIYNESNEAATAFYYSEILVLNILLISALPTVNSSCQTNNPWSCVTWRESGGGACHLIA